jgi:hypothetical protein
MSSEPENVILGTRVPDTAIHRASMWMDDVKFGNRRFEASVEPMEEANFTWRAFIEESGADFTVEELQEAAKYYGVNLYIGLTGGKVALTVTTPTGQMFLHDIFVSVWLDGFMIGYAAAKGKRGLSRAEMETQGLL